MNIKYSLIKPPVVYSRRPKAACVGGHCTWQPVRCRCLRCLRCTWEMPEVENVLEVFEYVLQFHNDLLRLEDLATARRGAACMEKEHGA